MRKGIKKLCFLSILLLIPFGCENKSNKTTKTTERTTITTNENHVHSFGEWEVLVDSTCIEKGRKRRYCACGKFEEDEISLKDHDYVNDVCTICGAERLTSGFDIDYNDEASTYLIRGYSGTSTTVTITKTYNDGVHGVHDLLILSNIDGDTSTCCLSEANIKKIRLAKDYTEMDRAMFSGMKNLEEVVLPSTLKIISEKAFQNCTKLSKVTFGGVTTIGHFAFDNCGFKKVTLPSGMKVLLSNAFSNNTSLTEIKLNDGLNEIGVNAFNNTAITTLEIPQTLTNFGYQERMASLNSFVLIGLNVNFCVSNKCLIDTYENSVIRACVGANIPTNVTSLGLYSFANLDYSSSSTFVIPTNIEYISSYAFAESKFNDIDFGQIEGLGNKVFYNTRFNSYESKTLTLPNTLTLINDGAFQNIYVNEVIIPKSVETLGDDIFKGSKVTAITIYRTTLQSDYCSMYWDRGITLTPTIIEE